MESKFKNGEEVECLETHTTSHGHIVEKGTLADVVECDMYIDTSTVLWWNGVWEYIDNDKIKSIDK